MDNVTIQIQLLKIKEKRFDLQTDHTTIQTLQTQNLRVGMSILTTPYLTDNQIKLQITNMYLTSKENTIAKRSGEKSLYSWT